MSFWAGALNPNLAMRASMRPYKGPVVGTAREFYEVLDDYYRNNALYESLHARAVAVGILDPTILGLRNPANRVVEFYAKKCWPGSLPSALPMTAAKQTVIDAIHLLWKASNWSIAKTIWAREVALYGDGFLKVSTVNNDPTDLHPQGTAKRVYLQRIDPKLVTDFTYDERQFITAIRIDQQLRKFDEYGHPVVSGPIEWHTEVWNKEEMSVWTHSGTAYQPVEMLGDPDPGYPIPLSTWGIDFVPFVHAKFRDIGDDRGVCAFQHTLDKIDDVNRSATRLNAQLYRHNDNTWVLTASGYDAARRPMPQLQFGAKGQYSTLPQYTIAGTRLFSLPGNYALDSLVPKIDYAASLSVLVSAIEELSDDLPEMAFYRTRDFGTNLSGVALTLILGPAISNVIEMRGNVETALIRAQQMALTIGQNLNVDGYAGLGDYENGDLDHEFSDRPVIPITQIEMLAAAAQKEALGVPRKQILIELGYNEDQVDQWLAEADAKQQESLQAQQGAAAVQAAQIANTANAANASNASPLVADALNRATQPNRTNPRATSIGRNGH